MISKLDCQELKVQGTLPSPRFGHSFTLLPQAKALLFGGAIGESGKFVITNDAYLFDFNLSKWRKLNSTGQVPSARAAHAASGMDSGQLILFGGAASGMGVGLSDDQLYMMEIVEDKVQLSGRWRVLRVGEGEKRVTPGRRYGHTMIFSKPYIIVIGGNIGSSTPNETSSIVCDVWMIKIDSYEGPFLWQKYQFKGKVPAPRVYHSATLCQEGDTNGMIVVFGGRTEEIRKNNSTGQVKKIQVALNDCWGLRRHRDGTVDWVKAPCFSGVEPICRFQHWAQFVGPLMFIVGGRTNGTPGANASLFQDSTSVVDIYDTSTSEWLRYEGLYRYRHAMVALKPYLFVHGGFHPGHPSLPQNSIHRIDLRKIPAIMRKEMIVDQKIDRLGSTSQSRISKREDGRSSVIRETTPSRSNKSARNIKLSNQVIVATAITEKGQSALQMKKVPVDSLPQESKKLIAEPSIGLNLKQHSLAEMFITSLVTPSKTILSGSFPFKRQYIAKLCEESKNLLEMQPTLVHMRPPLKVFGNLYGRYSDLLQFFQNFGAPEDHEFESYDYLFLGNYVNKGSNSLETICLLLALFLKYPEHIVLLRGSYDDLRPSRIFGFQQQCVARLGENTKDPTSVFQNFCRVFQLMPLAALVDQRILCVHSGIGRQVRTLTDIEEIKRPLVISKKERVAVDLLWSQIGSSQGPTERGRDVFSLGASKFTEKRLKAFLAENSLSMLIRSHQVCNQGFEYNTDNQCINLNSCTGYGGKFGNSAAGLKITKNEEFVPLLIKYYKADRMWVNQSKNSLGLSEEELAIRKRLFTPPKKMFV